MRKALSFQTAAHSDMDYWLNVEACYLRTWTNYKMFPHYHSRAEIMYVLKGSCEIHIMLSQKGPSGTERPTARVETLNACDFIFLDVGVIHSLEVPEVCHIANAEFSLSPTTDGFVSMKKLSEHSQPLNQFLQNAPPVARGIDRQGKLYQALTNVVDNYLEKLEGGEYQTLYDVQLAELVLRLANALNGKQESLSALYARKAYAILQKDFSQDLSVDGIAKAIGINASYLQRVFKQARGETIIDSLNRIRVQHAKLLLANTRDSVIDIAMYSGFHSRQYFSRVFMRLTGQSPLTFRQQFLRANNQDIFLFDNVHDDFLDYHI